MAEKKTAKKTAAKKAPAKKATAKKTPAGSSAAAPRETPPFEPFEGDSPAPPSGTVSNRPAAEESKPHSAVSYVDALKNDSGL